MTTGEGELSKGGDAWEIRFERSLRHPQAEVWSAIVGPGAMDRWFDETHMPDPLEAGAVIRFVHGRYGMQSRGEIVAVDAPRLIEWLWVSDFGPSARMGFEVRPEGPGSTLVLRQQVADPTVTARSLAGWHKSLDRLQQALGDAVDDRDWVELFEAYRSKVAEAGITVAQAGAPAPATTS